MTNDRNFASARGHMKNARNQCGTLDYHLTHADELDRDRIARDREYIEQEVREALEALAEAEASSVGEKEIALDYASAAFLLGWIDGHERVAPEVDRIHGEIEDQLPIGND